MAPAPAGGEAAAAPAAEVPMPVRMDPKEQMRNAAEDMQRRQDMIDRVRERNKRLEPKRHEQHEFLLYEPPELPSIRVDLEQDDGNAETKYVDVPRCVCCCFNC